MHTLVQGTTETTPMPKRPRAHRRTLFSVPFHLRPIHAQGPKDVHAISLDISVGGIGALVQGNLHVGETVQIDLPLGKLTLSMSAVVRYTSAGRSGFEFLHLNDGERRQISRLIGAA
jgi:c-di-GMP-binding flagellar brake protein YcgR